MLKKLLPLAFVLGFFLVSGSSNADFEYIGAAKCKICHNKPPKGEQYNKWAKSPHAKAMESLKGDDAKNPKCLKCHSTYAVINQDLNQTLKENEGVSCESCHGPGSAYKSTAIMKNKEKAKANGLIIPDEKVCKTCHNAESPNFKGFDFKTYYAKIAHEDPTRE